MNKEGKPVNNRIEHLTEELKAQLGYGKALELDLQNTEIAFGDKTDQELKKTAWLFKMMNKYWLVKFGSKIGIKAVKWNLPFVEQAVKNTIFKQFCGGTTLLDSQTTINRLFDSNIVSILDYGAEAKEGEEDFNHTMNENIRALEFAATNESAWMISTKITGLARFALLEKKSLDHPLDASEQKEWVNVRKRIDAICHKAADLDVRVLIDAEETWIQAAIDGLVQDMMIRYNTEKAIVYNTFQMYRKGRLEFLKDSFVNSQQMGYILGAKLVRGAYMEKERARAIAMDYPSPIHDTKEATDTCFNEGLAFCVEHYKKIAIINASHNEKSCMLMAQLITKHNLDKSHPHLLFAQLLGMSDNLTYNLAKHGFQSAKYVVYGAVKEVVPFLIRRAQENSSVTGDMTRELRFVDKELKRRGLKL